MNRPSKQTGFTLLEVLVTVVVLAIGLLGLAGLQVNALRNNLSAEQRAQAAQLVYDMGDRIRSNYEDAILGAGSAYDDAAVSNASSAIPSCNTAANACSPAQVATRDVFLWNELVNNTLPSPITTISESAGMFTVTVNWDDNRDGITDANDPSFSVSVVP